MQLYMELNSQLRSILILGMLIGLVPGRDQGQSTTPADTRRQAALALEQQGNLADAESAWQLLLKSHPTDAEAYAHLGFLEARQEHYKKAVSFYRKALALNPSMPGLRLNLGLSLFKGGELKEAIQVFQPLQKTESRNSPEALRLRTLIGLAHYGLGDYAAAIPYLKEATASDSQNLPFRLALAHSCLWSKQYQCVLDVYHEIVTLNAESAEADMLAGEAYDEMKNDAGAIEQFKAAVKADPKLPNVHFGYGYLLWRQLKYEEAESEFKAEIANTPEHASALAYLGDTEIHLGRPEDAPPFLLQAIQIEPTLALAHLDLGIVYSDQGRKDDALRELLVAAKLSPDDQNVHWRLGRFYQMVGKKVEAKAEFDKTRNLQKAADQTVFRELHQAQSKGPAPHQNAGSPAPK
jgi:tetratricopeptide (TPR) repeat protein